MTHLRRAPGARPSPEGRARFGRVREFFSRPWAKLGLRALVALAGLVVLVLIGSNAKAVPSVPIATPTAPSASTGTPAAASASTGPSPSPVVDHARRATADDPVHLNSAALDDLERLPGIGPKRAAAILSLRAKLGRFREIEDLMRVKGIGRATLKKLRPVVRLD